MDVPSGSPGPSVVVVVTRPTVPGPGDPGPVSKAEYNVWDFLNVLNFARKCAEMC